MISLAPVPPRFACPMFVVPRGRRASLRPVPSGTRGGEVRRTPRRSLVCHLRTPSWESIKPLGNIVWASRGFALVFVLRFVSSGLSEVLFWAVLGPLLQAASWVSTSSTTTPSTTGHSRQRSRSRGSRPAVLRRHGHGRFPPPLATDWQQAREEYFRDFFAPSNQPSVQSRLKFAHRALGIFALPPLPPTVEKIHCLGMVLKSGGYASAANYFAAYKGLCERSGCSFDSSMLRAVRDGVRSATRGLGGPVRAAPLPFDQLRKPSDGHVPWHPGGPVGSRNFVVLGSWFMLREIEAASTLAEHVTVVEDVGDGTPKVVWELPTSKTDQKALGTVRSHGCCCRAGFDRLCPAHSAWDQLLLLRRRFGSGPMQRLPPGLPLFPDMGGNKCSKEVMAATIERAASALQVPLSSPDGCERISGHTLRVTGAQGMAKFGLDLWAIQLLGRWGVQRHCRLRSCGAPRCSGRLGTAGGSQHAY